jgi:glycosyltransferase involved in cell wall biosynthesis
MDQKIKILHILTRLIAAGADENTIFTVEGVDKNLFESDLLVGSDSEIIEDIRKKGINILVEKALKRNISPINDLKALYKITKLLSNSQYQIVHTHTSKAGFIGRIAAKLAGVPVIIHTLHGLSFHEFMPKWQKYLYISMEKIVGKFTDLFISVGKNIKEKSISVGIGDAKNYVTIYSGMNLSKFENVNINLKKLKMDLGISIDAPIIGTVVRLEPRKGPQYFVDVIAKIQKKYSDIIAIIVGEGSYKSELERKIRKLKLEKNIILTGYRQDIAEVISLIDVVCLTSLWEGIPRVLIQGAKLGKPLVAFDIDGNSEVIKNGINGYIIPALDIDQFAIKTLQIIRNKKLKCKMSIESKKIIDQKWDKNYMAQKIQEQYLRICKEKLNIN